MSIFGKGSVETEWPNLIYESFVGVHHYGIRNEFIAGYPNFQNKQYNNYSTHGAILLTSGQYHEIPALDSFEGHDVLNRFHTARNHARRGFVGALALLDRAGAYFFKRYDAVKKLVRRHEIGSPKPSDYAGHFRGIDEYALRNGFAGGFPTYRVFQNREGEVVYEIILLRKHAAVRREIPSIYVRAYQEPFVPPPSEKFIKHRFSQLLKPKFDTSRQFD